MNSELKLISDNNYRMYLEASLARDRYKARAEALAGCLRDLCDLPPGSTPYLDAKASARVLLAQLDTGKEKKP